MWMSRADFYMCKTMAADGPSDVPEDAIRFYRRAGFTAERLDRYRQRFGQFGASIAPLPAGYRRIREGQYLEIDGREWRAVIGHGHAPEHVCLYCPELKIIIGGDQLLPKITPNVSVQPSEPQANPLREWISSCGRFRELLPPNLLVLPAHENLYHLKTGRFGSGHDSKRPGSTPSLQTGGCQTRGPRTAIRTRERRSR